MKLIITSALYLLGVNAQTPSVTPVYNQACDFDNECIDQNGDGCCMLEDDGTTVTKLCRSELYRKQRLDSIFYDKTTKFYYGQTWRGLMFCSGSQEKKEVLSERAEQGIYPNFPYEQHHKPRDYEQKRDAWIPAMTTDMFYIAHEPQELGEEVEKLFWVWLSGHIPFFDLIFEFPNELLWWWDVLINVLQGDRWMFFTSLYMNPLAELIYGSGEAPWGVFKYYDLFTTQGWRDLHGDRFLINVVPIVPLFVLLWKIANEQYGYIWPQYVNKNIGFMAGDLKLFILLIPVTIAQIIFYPLILLIYPFSSLFACLLFLGNGKLEALALWALILPAPMWFCLYLYWGRYFNFKSLNEEQIVATWGNENNPDNIGLDCNGVEGHGNTCWCESQGYNCGCRPNGQKEPRLICEDYIGFDCDGVTVDGKEKWCWTEGNFYYILNMRQEERRLSFEI